MRTIHRTTLSALAAPSLLAAYLVTAAPRPPRPRPASRTPRLPQPGACHVAGRAELDHRDDRIILVDLRPDRSRRRPLRRRRQSARPRLHHRSATRRAIV